MLINQNNQIKIFEEYVNIRYIRLKNIKKFEIILEFLLIPMEIGVWVWCYFLWVFYF